jgi:plasmid stability protein
MPVPVKVSDKLMKLAKVDAAAAHRSATAQIEHWATLGRAVEVIAAYRDVLALKTVGRALPFPTFARADDVREILDALAVDHERTGVRAHIAGKGTPVYEADPERPGGIVEIRPDGARVRGRLEERRFVPDPE